MLIWYLMVESWRVSLRERGSYSVAQQHTKSLGKLSERAVSHTMHGWTGRPALAQLVWLAVAPNGIWVRWRDTIHSGWEANWHFIWVSLHCVVNTYTLTLLFNNLTATFYLWCCWLLLLISAFNTKSIQAILNDNQCFIFKCIQWLSIHNLDVFKYKINHCHFSGHFLYLTFSWHKINVVFIEYFLLFKHIKINVSSSWHWPGSNGV